MLGPPGGHSDNRSMTRTAPRVAALALAAACVVACSPALDWRESRPEGADATLMFPCRPGKVERTVRLAGATLAMQQYACTAGGALYSLSAARAATPESVPTLLAAWRSEAAGNVGGVAIELPPPSVSGATPNVHSGFVRLVGRLPDQRPVVEHAAFFVRGTRLYQAAVVSTTRPVEPEALDNFFGAIRLQ